LPIGGLKEKLIAALRGGLTTVLIPKDNEKDLAEIPDNVKRGLDIRPVSVVDEVISVALTTQPVPVSLDDEEELKPLAVSDDEDARDGVVTH